jgi:hypothetical protein
MYTTNRLASLNTLIVCGWRKEEGKVQFVDKKKSDLEIDRHNRSIQKSELKTKKHDRSIKESEQQAITIARYKN